MMSNLIIPSPADDLHVHSLADDDNFFQITDRLRTCTESPSNIESAKRELDETKTKREKLQGQLVKLQIERREMKLFCKEQRDRIACVSYNWFYGTIIFQPQLWLRGGCKGKIERAKRKLDNTRENLPRIQTFIRHLEIVELPEIERQVELRLEDLEFLTTAETKRQNMEENAISQFPSPTLLALQYIMESIHEEINNTKQAEDSLDSIIIQFDSSIHLHYGIAKTHLKEAAAHNIIYESIERSDVSSVDRSQVDKIDQSIIDMSFRENDIVNRSYSEGRKEIKQAERNLRLALASVPIFIRERHSRIFTELVNSTKDQFLNDNPRGGCQSSQERRLNIQQTIDLVTHAISLLDEQLRTVQSLRSDLRRQDTQRLEIEKAVLDKNIEAEKKRILVDLRKTRSGQKQ
ncbi:MAG: hypothetical protein ACI90V_006835 [Bacillariaceae sp.]|jgi:hypothetical protein